MRTVNDPHVEWLTYDFLSQGKHHDFRAAEAWDGRLGDFACHLAKAQLQAVPQVGYTDPVLARNDLEPILRAWELYSELEVGIRIRFRFSGSRVFDRAAIPGAASAEHTVSAEFAFAAEAAIVAHSSYPTPPNGPFVPSALVEELMGWIRDLRTGQRLLVIAYLVLTRLEFEYGGRHQLSSALNVSLPVLNTLAQLGIRNDPAERRKVKGPVSSLSEAEKGWIRAALLKLVRRVAEVEDASPPSQLTVADLPQL